MRRHSRRAAAVVLAAAMVGCGSGGDEAAQTTDTAEQPPEAESASQSPQARREARRAAHLLTREVRKADGGKLANVTCLVEQADEDIWRCTAIRHQAGSSEKLVYRAHVIDDVGVTFSVLETE